MSNTFAVVQPLEELTPVLIHLFQINKYSLDWMTSDRDKWPAEEIEFHEISKEGHSSGWKRGLVKFIGDHEEAERQLAIFLEEVKFEPHNYALQQEIVQLKTRLTAAEQKIDELTLSNFELTANMTLIMQEFEYLKEKLPALPTDQLFANVHICGRHKTIISNTDLELAVGKISDIKGFHHLVVKASRVNTEGKVWKGLTTKEQEIFDDLMEFFLQTKMLHEEQNPPAPSTKKIAIQAPQQHSQMQLLEIQEQLQEQQQLQQKQEQEEQQQAVAIISNSTNSTSEGDKKRKRREVDLTNFSARVAELKVCYQKKLCNDEARKKKA